MDRVRKQRTRLDALRAQRREENVSTSIEDAKKGTHRFLLMSSRRHSSKYSGSKSFSGATKKLGLLKNRMSKKKRLFRVSKYS